MAIYTFFFTKYEHFLDTDARNITKGLKWLFIKKNEVKSVGNYISIVISASKTMPTSSTWKTGLKQMAYDVVLVKKGAKSQTHVGFGAFENYLLKSLVRNKEDAIDVGRELGKVLNLPVSLEGGEIIYDPALSF